MNKKPDWIDMVIRDLCEIPGRDSPDYDPEIMLVTSDEIRKAIEYNILLELKTAG